MISKQNIWTEPALYFLNWRFFTYSSSVYRLEKDTWSCPTEYLTLECTSIGPCWAQGHSIPLQTVLGSHHKWEFPSELTFTFDHCPNFIERISWQSQMDEELDYRSFISLVFRWCWFFGFISSSWSDLPLSVKQVGWESAPPCLRKWSSVRKR